MRAIRFRRLLLLLLAACALPVLAGSDTPVDQATIQKNRQANQACLACHSSAGIAAPPQAGLDLSSLKDSHVEPDIYNRADHGVMDCRECHSKTHYTDYPHAEAGKRETVGCTDCHAGKVLRLEPQFNASVHAKVAGVKEKFTCNTCHNAHVAVVQKRLKDPALIVAQDNHGCLECHDDEATFARFAPDAKQGPGKKKRPDIDAIHGWLPNTQAHWSAVRCIECHTPEVAEGKMLSHEILDKEKAEKRCLTCHSTNSTLRVRLYRHLVADEQAKLGFTNSAILANSYVIGATRHPLLDRIVIGVLALTFVGVVIHGVVRAIAARRRKGQSS